MILRFRRLIAAAANALVTAAIVMFAGAAPTQASTASCAPGIGTRTPVIFVHGFLGKASDWNTMVATVTKQVPDADPVSFDYSAENTQWVDDSNIGPKLATTVVCVAAASKDAGGPGKVIVVAHSMGGLAMRYAATMTQQASTVVADTALVVTIGTPNTGSGWANDVAPLLYSLCHPVTLTGEAPAPPKDSYCTALNALAGLADMSSEIAKLPKLPSNVPVLAIAGNVTLDYPFFHTKLIDTSSDLVVSEKSALWGQTANGLGGTSAISCSTTASIHLLDTNCWHSALPSNPQVVAQTVSAIQRYASMFQAMQKYVGTWFAPDSGLAMVMTANGQAAFSMVGDQFVAQFSPSGNGLAGKITSTQEPNLAFKVGDPLALSLNADGGIHFNAYEASDPTELYPARTLSYYVGQWYAHGVDMTISGSGTGTMTYRDYGPCPLPTSTDFYMCNITINFTFQVTVGGATATITSSSASLNNGDGSGTVTGSSKLANGTEVQLYATSTNGLVMIDMTPLLYGETAAQPFYLCKNGTGAYNTGQCGA